MADSILIGSSSQGPVTLPLKLINRHGLIAGATGTGKTVTLQRLVESLADEGVACFVADVKGDLSGLAAPSASQDFVVKRYAELNVVLNPEACAVEFWDLYGKTGTPIRATVSGMGPLMLSRLLELNETQEGVLNIAFEVADEQGMSLLDLKDLRAMLTHVQQNAKTLGATYGNIAPATVGAILRALLVLEQQGADRFFGEPAMDVKYLIQTNGQGKGVVNILDARTLIESPRLYATFLMWLLSAMFETLPEIGDPEKPVLAFFFDEAHLLFDDVPKPLLDKIEQVVRLIRSKGVGVYFITQNPIDIPDSVAAQLGHRVQHALRAFTPSAQKDLKKAAQSFRANPDFETEAVLTQLAIGEALVSTLDKSGTPSIVQKTMILPPHSQVGILDDARRNAVNAGSQMHRLYAQAQDRVSAHEILAKRTQQETKPSLEKKTPERTCG